MLYICIPAYNEAPTIGVLLWRIRSVFQEYAREYELVVYDDASTDATAEVLEPYARVLPLTVLRGTTRLGYAGAVDALCRHVAAHTRYPRRDAMILLQGDFTDRPEHIPELVKRFEGGADLVVAERAAQPSDPIAVRRLQRAARWVLRPFVRLEGVIDLTSGYLLIRISLLRDLLRERGDRPLVSADGWGANAELLLALAPFARRVETTPVEPRFDVRPRPTRIRPFADAVALFRFGWRSRGSAGGSRGPAPLRRPEVDADAPVREVAGANAIATPATAELQLEESPSPRRERTRTKRPRPDRSDERPARDSERPPREAAPPPRARRKPEPPPIDLTDELDTDVTGPLGDEERVPTERKRRKRSRRSGEKRARLAELESAGDSSAPPLVSDDISPDLAGSIDVRDAAEERGIEGEGGDPGDGTARPAKRRRRARGRRSTLGVASADDEAPESSAVAAEVPLPDVGGDASAQGDGEGGAARTARRSRRGKRRSRRPGADASGSESGSEGGDGIRPGASDAESPRGDE